MYNSNLIVGILDSLPATDSNGCGVGSENGCNGCPPQK
jgi:hypothetical protein